MSDPVDVRRGAEEPTGPSPNAEQEQSPPAGEQTALDWGRLAHRLDDQGAMALASMARRLADPKTADPIPLFSERIELSNHQAQQLLLGRASEDLLDAEREYSRLLGDADLLTSFEPLSMTESEEIGRLGLAAGLLPEFILVFDHRHYYWANRSAFPRGQEPPSRGALIGHFVEHGLTGGFSYGDGETLQPEFYAEAYGLPHARTNAILTRHWMSDGIARGFSPNVDHWLVRKGIIVFGRLGSTCNIDMVRAAAPHLGEAAAATGWTDAVEHLLSGGRIDLSVLAPLTPQGAWFLLSAADHLDRGGLHEAAYCILEFLCDSPHVGAEARISYARQLRHRGHPLSALMLLEGVVNSPRANEAAFLFMSETMADLGRYEEALAVALRGHARWGADPGLTSRARQAAAAYVSDAFVRASAALLFDRAQADRLIREMWATLERHLAPKECAPKRIGRRVAMLANLDLPQCRFYRVEQKSRQLDALGCHHSVYDKNTQVQELLANLTKYDILLMYRVAADVNVMCLVQAAKNLGLHVVYEIDDLIFDTDAFPPPFDTYGGLITRSTYHALQMEAVLSQSMLRISEAGIASTDALAEAMRPYVSEVLVHRNGYDDRHLQAMAAAPETSPEASADLTVTAFYGSGSSAHRSDAAFLLSNYLEDIAERCDGGRIVVSAGPLAAPAALRDGRRAVVEVSAHRSLPAFWADLTGMDINLAPLVASPLTDAKSEIKWLEAALFGVPSVVGATDTYRRVVRDHVDGVIAQTPAEWAEAIERLAADPVERRRMAERARARVLQDYSVEALAPPLGAFLSSFAEDRIDQRPLILVVNVYFPPNQIGGATRVVADNLAHFVAEASGEFRFATFSATYDWDRPRYELSNLFHRGVRSTYININPPGTRDEAYEDHDVETRFAELLDQERPTVVHFHCVQRLGVGVLRACAARGIPHVLTMHDAWWISPNQFLVDQDGREAMYHRDRDQGGRAFLTAADLLRQRTIWSALRRVDRILTVSERFADICRQAGVGDLQVIENGLSDLPAAAAKSTPQDRLVVGYVGGFDTHKGFDVLKEALLGTPLANISVLVVSHGLNDNLSYEELWGENRIKIIGKVQMNQVETLYSAIDVLVAPSVWPEAFGLVSREALHFGCWVLASNRGDVGSPVVEAQNGLTFDPTPDELAALLRKIDDNWQTYKHRPPQTVAIRRSRDQAAELLELYRSLTPEASRA